MRTGGGEGRARTSDRAHPPGAPACPSRNVRGPCETREGIGMKGSSAGDLAPGRAGRFPVLIPSAWCGLASGLLEVGTIVLRKRTFDPNHFYEMSRHFVWL